MPFKYTVYGFSIDSELELSGLPLGHGAPEVSVSLKKLPPSESILSANGSYFIAKPDFFFIDVKGIARFQVNHSTEILIDPAPEASKGDIRLYLLGAVFAALIQQRGELALHASAVMKDGRAVLFSGDSGAGKSTTALSLLSNHAWSLCADDVCRLTYIDNRAHLFPAYPSMKIWDEVIQAMNIPKEVLSPIQKQQGKYRMPITTDWPNKPIPIEHIFLLTKGSSDYRSLHSVKGGSKLMELRKLIYRSNFLQTVTTEDKVFQLLSKLLRDIPTTRIERSIAPITRAALDTQANQIQSHLINYTK